jgi:Cd2+/Zn2+-exporting ATPase
MSTSSARFVVSGVCCATEEGVLRACLDRRIGRDGYAFNLVTGELRVEGTVNPREIVASVRSAGFDARERRETPPVEPFFRRHRDALITLGAGLMTVAGALLDSRFPTAARVLFLAAILLGGAQPFRKAVLALRYRTLDMNVLMTVAVIGAVAIDRWAEGAAVIVLFAVSLLLEGYSAVRTRRAVTSLLDLAPATARVLDDGAERTVDAQSVLPGTRIVLRPGERIPLDGDVVGGSSTVNESSLTGESVPVPKHAGDAVFSGTVNERGMLTVRVTRPFEDSTISRIVRLIEEAQTHRASVQTFVDRFARRYTPFVLGLAVLVAVVPPLAGAGSFAEWLYRALVLLVIACPCALVISTPVTLVSALTAAARNGVLIKGGRTLEALSAVAAIAFDKTGTLTAGRLHLTDVVVLDSRPREQLLAVVAALEQHSEHPVADAVRDVSGSSPVQVEAFEAIPGLGVRGSIGGTPYSLGNRLLAEREGFLSPAAAEAVERLARDGKTTMILGSSHEALGVIGLADQPRKHVRDVLRDLRSAGVRHLVMLSGDHQEAAARAAAALGITEVRADLLPAGKTAAVAELRRTYGSVAMVGDGLNDAPALAEATVGIAMGVAGSDATLESADVVLMADDLHRLPFVLRLSRRTMHIIYQNVALALGLKILFLVLTVTGHASLWAAVLADDGAAFAVILNGLRLLTFHDRH